jgi:RimJ/RimL family protein N-acetyltransferase
MTIHLEKVDLNDAPKIAEWKSDPILARMIMSAFKKTSLSKAKKWIIETNSDENQKLNGIYHVEDDVKNLIGITRLMYIDWQSKVAELGMYIGDEHYRRRGLGKIAISKTLKQGFFNLGLRKIFLKVAEGNCNAVQLYLRNGFEIEGKLRQHFKADQSYENILLMSKFNPQ